MNISTSLNVFEINHPIDKFADARKRASALDSYWDYQETVAKMTWQEEAWAEHPGDRRQPRGALHANARSCPRGSFTEMVMGLNVESFLEMASRSIRMAGILGVPWVVFHPSPLSLRGKSRTRKYSITTSTFIASRFRSWKRRASELRWRTFSIGPAAIRALPQNLLRDSRTASRTAHEAQSSAVRRVLGYGARPPAGLTQAHSIRMLGKWLKTRTSRTTTASTISICRTWARSIGRKSCPRARSATRVTLRTKRIIRCGRAGRHAGCAIRVRDGAILAEE